MPDLSGDLGTFDLRQILTLLAETHKTGELRIAVDGETARTFLHDGQVVYATLRTGNEAVREVEALMDWYGSGAADRHEPGEGQPARSPEEALEDQVIEVFFTVTQLGSGSFHFDEDAGVAPYNADGSYVLSVPAILDCVEDRVEQWGKIGEVIDSIHDPYRPAAQLPNGMFEVTLDGKTFRYLSVLGGGRSVVEVAAALHVSEFTAAKKLSDLVKQGLAELSETEQPAPELGDDAADHDRAGESQHDAGDDESKPAPEEAFAPANLPRVQPVAEPVTFATRDLTRDEINEKIRNFSRGIYSTD